MGGAAAKPAGSTRAAATSADPAYQGLAGPPFGVTVHDNDAYGTLQFAASSLLVEETGGSAVLTVTRTGGGTGALTASYQSANGSATAGEDYVVVSGTLQWGHLEAGSKTIAIPLIDDALPEAPETFTVALTSATADVSGVNVLGTPAAATVTILDDDNTAPAILLETPVAGAAVQVGDVLPLRATVTSNTATITAVAFRINGTVVSTQTAPLSGQLYGFDAVVPFGTTGGNGVRGNGVRGQGANLDRMQERISKKRVLRPLAEKRGQIARPHRRPHVKEGRMRRGESRLTSIGS